MYFEQALTALTHLPETQDTLEVGVDIRLALRNSHWPLGHHETASEHLRDAERLATALGQPRQLGWIAAYLSEHARMSGHAPDAPALAERALAIAEGLGDLSLCVAANYYLGTAHFVVGDYRRTDEAFPRILRLLAGNLVRERCGLAGFPAVMARFFWISAMIERGDFGRGLIEAQAAMVLAEALDHPYSLTHALLASGRLHGVRGNLDHAIQLTERALALSRDFNLAQPLPMVADVLGHLYALSGRVAEGISLLEEALRAMESMRMVQWRSPLIARLGETYLLADRPEDAFTLMGHGLALAREHGHRGAEASARRLLGDIASHHDRPDVGTAEAHYGAAMTLASPLGMRPLIAHCHLGLARLYRRSGKREQAREHIAAATTTYREMEMALSLAQAETEMAAVESGQR